MKLPTYDYLNINWLSQMETIKNKAIWGAWIVHNKLRMKNTKESSTKDDQKTLIQSKVRVAKYHHNIILLMVLLPSVIEDVYLSFRLWGVAPNE